MCIEWNRSALCRLRGRNMLEPFIDLRSCYRPGIAVAIVLTNPRCTAFGPTAKRFSRVLGMLSSLEVKVLGPT